MARSQCPGQDMRNWGPDDIFEVPCPACKEPVEFFKTDNMRKCRACGFRFPNPKLNLGCAEWCPAAADCGAARLFGPVGAGAGGTSEGSNQG